MSVVAQVSLPPSLHSSRASKSTQLLLNTRTPTQSLVPSSTVILNPSPSSEPGRSHQEDGLNSGWRKTRQAVQRAVQVSKVSDIGALSSSLGVEPRAGDQLERVTPASPRSTTQRQMSTNGTTTTTTTTTTTQAPMPALSQQAQASQATGSARKGQSIAQGSGSIRPVSATPGGHKQGVTAGPSHAGPSHAGQHGPPLSHTPHTSSPSRAEDSQIVAFAKLEFDDGAFYMNTYAVVLGRDMRAAKDRLRQNPGIRPAKKSSSSSLGRPASQSKHKKNKKDKKNERVSRSVISETGGVMALDVSDEEEESEFNDFASAVGLPHEPSFPGPAKIPIVGGFGSGALSSRALDNTFARPVSGSWGDRTTTSSTPMSSTSLSRRASGVHPVDPFNLLPSPEECPLVPVHPRADAVAAGGHTSISRRHVKIAYNFERYLFELHVLGRNGAFIDDRWHPAGEVVPLHSGANVQIGGVRLGFVLPDGDHDEAEEEETGYEGVEEEVDEGQDEDDEEAEAEIASVSELSGDDEEEDDSGTVEGDEIEDGDEVDEEESVVETVEHTPSPAPAPVPVKRGRGRPPKHGRYSKEKPAQVEKDKQPASDVVKAAPAPVVVEKRKVGRPRKHPLPDPLAPKPEKRKYTRRKGVEGVDSTDNNKGAEQAPKNKVKPPKTKRPPRSPSPVFDETKLSEEELKKPSTSYVIMIHDALTNSPTRMLSLPQIYRAIERRYPYFKLRSETNGWQSSVRHNLSQHDAFRKLECEGRGWVWGLVPGVSIEKERKKKAAPAAPAASSTPPQQPTPTVQPVPSHAGGKIGNVPQMIAATTPVPPPGMQSAAPMTSTQTTAQLLSRLAPTYALNRPAAYQSPYAPAPPSSSQATARNPMMQTPQPTPAGAASSVAGRPHLPAQNGVPVPQYSASRPAPQQPSSTTTTTTTTTVQQSATPPRPPMLRPEIRKAVQSFQTALVKSMPRTKHSEMMVQSAINRVLGWSSQSSVTPGQDDPQEVTIMNALSKIIRGSTTESPSPSPSAGAGAGAGGMAQPNVTRPAAISPNLPHQPSRAVGNGVAVKVEQTQASFNAAGPPPPPPHHSTNGVSEHQGQSHLSVQQSPMQASTDKSRASGEQRHLKGTSPARSGPTPPPSTPAAGTKRPFDQTTASQNHDHDDNGDSIDVGGGGGGGGGGGEDPENDGIRRSPRKRRKVVLE